MFQSQENWAPRIIPRIQKSHWLLTLIILSWAWTLGEKTGTERGTHLSGVLVRVSGKVRRMDDKEGGKMHKGSAFNSVVAAPERAHLAKLLTSKRHKTATKPTKQMDGHPSFLQAVLSRLHCIIIPQQKYKREKTGTCNTVTRKEKNAKGGPARAQLQSMHATSFLHLAAFIVKGEEMLPSVSAQGCPWWKHRKAMRNRHWVCREGLQFTRERGETPAGVLTTPVTCHCLFASEPFSKGAPMHTVLVALLHNHKPYQSV